MATREEDFVSQLFVAATHAPVLFFTPGRVYKLKVYACPMARPRRAARRW